MAFFHYRRLRERRWATIDGVLCCCAALQAYHQNYYNDNPNQGYCRVVVAPKVAKFRSKYMSKLIKA